MLLHYFPETGKVHRPQPLPRCDHLCLHLTTWPKTMSVFQIDRLLFCVFALGMPFTIGCSAFNMDYKTQKSASEGLWNRTLQTFHLSTPVENHEDDATHSVTSAKLPPRSPKKAVSLAKTAEPSVKSVKKQAVSRDAEGQVIARQAVAGQGNMSEEVATERETGQTADQSDFSESTSQPARPEPVRPKPAPTTRAASKERTVSGRLVSNTSDSPMLAEFIADLNAADLENTPLHEEMIDELRQIEQKGDPVLLQCTVFELRKALLPEPSPEIAGETVAESRFQTAAAPVSPDPSQAASDRAARESAKDEQTGGGGEPVLADSTPLRKKTSAAPLPLETGPISSHAISREPDRAVGRLPMPRQPESLLNATHTESGGGLRHSPSPTVLNDIPHRPLFSEAITGTSPGGSVSSRPDGDPENSYVNRIAPAMFRRRVDSHARGVAPASYEQAVSAAPDFSRDLPHRPIANAYEQGGAFREGKQGGRFQGVFRENPIRTNNYVNPGGEDGSFQPSFRHTGAAASARGDYGTGSAETEELLRAATERLGDRIAARPNARSAPLDEARLRIIEMLLGNTREAARPIKGLPPAERNFFSSSMLGFASFLDETTYVEGRDRITAVAHHIDAGRRELAPLCPLKLRNVQFVSGCDGFGAIKFREAEFTPGEPMHVYLEMENITIHETGTGFTTKALAAYEIRDAESRVLQEERNVEAPGSSGSRRRDHFLCLSFDLRKDLPPGKYFLRVTVSDQQHESRQSAEEQIPFRIVSKNERANAD